MKSPYKQMNSKCSYLFVHEWLFLVFFMGLLIALTAVSVLNRNQLPTIETANPHYVVDPIIEITILGELENPGLKKVPRGSTVGEAIRTVQLLPGADLSKLKKLSKVRPGQKINIPSATHLTIFIGDKPVKVPRGVRMSDLPHLLELSKESVGNFRSRRKLKDGERLNI